MAFKLIQEGGDWPVLMCDVCGGRIADMWNDLASGTRGSGTVVIHHKTCATTEQSHMTLVDFFGLFMSKNRIGDLSLNGTTERVSVDHEVGKEFEP